MSMQRDARKLPIARTFVFAFLAAVLCAPTAHASCIGPQISQLQGTALEADAQSSDVEIAPGGVLNVAGEWYVIGCDDARETGMGCSTQPSEALEPMTDVPITLSEDGGRTWDLGTVNATGDRFAVNWSGSVPDDVTPGPATLTVGPTSIAVAIAG